MELANLLIPLSEANEAATYMTPQRCEMIRSKLKGGFDEIGYNRITDIDIKTTDGYQIQVNFDSNTDSSDVQKAREICKEVLGNDWLESNAGDNQLMFVFGNANESNGADSGLGFIDLAAENIEEPTGKEKASMKKFDEKNVALEEGDDESEDDEDDDECEKKCSSKSKKKSSKKDEDDDSDDKDESEDDEDEEDDDKKDKKKKSDKDEDNDDDEDLDDDKDKEDDDPPEDDDEDDVAVESATVKAIEAFLNKHGEELYKILKECQKQLNILLYSIIKSDSNWAKSFYTEKVDFNEQELLGMNTPFLFLKLKARNKASKDNIEDVVSDFENSKRFKDIITECKVKASSIMPKGSYITVTNEKNPCDFSFNIYLSDNASESSLLLYDIFTTTKQYDRIVEESLGNDLLKEAAKSPVAIGGGILALTAIGFTGYRGFKSIIEARHKKLLEQKAKKDEELKKIEAEKAAEKNHQLYKQWLVEMKPILERIPSMEVNKEKILRASEFKKACQMWAKHLNILSRKYPGFGSNFDGFDSDVDDFFNMNIFSYVISKNEQENLSLGCDLDIQYWVYKKYPEESESCNMKDKNDKIRRLCDEMLEDVLYEYDKFRDEANKFNTISVALSDWSKYEGYGLMKFHHSEKFGEICRNCGYQSFDSWKKNK